MYLSFFHGGVKQRMKQWYTIPNDLNRNQAFEGREYALKKLIEFRCYPLDRTLDKLLIDKTTGKRIIWVTERYSEYGDNSKGANRFKRRHTQLQFHIEQLILLKNNLLYRSVLRSGKIVR